MSGWAFAGAIVTGMLTACVPASAWAQAMMKVQQGENGPVTMRMGPTPTVNTPAALADAPYPLQPGPSSVAVICGRETKPPPDCGLDVNSAPAEVMAKLPGLDIRTALAIVAARPYARAVEMTDRGVMTNTTFNLVRNYLWALPVRINSASEKELTERLGLTADVAARVAAGRPWHNLDDLMFHGILRIEDMERVKATITLR